MQSLTYSQTYWSVKSSGPQEATLSVKLVDAVERNRADQGIAARAGQKAAVDGIVGTTVDPGLVAANPTMMVVISALALVTNALALGWIICIAKKRHINPYKEDVFVDQKYYKDAMARAVVD